MSGKNKGRRQKLIKRLSLFEREIPRDQVSGKYIEFNTSSFEQFEKIAFENGFSAEEQIRRVVDAFNAGQLTDTAGLDRRRKTA